MPDKKNKKIFLIITFAVIVTAVLIAVYRYLCVSCYGLEIFKPENIRNYIQSFGTWAIAVYICLYIINTIVLLPPIAIMSLSAGALFGLLWGTVAVLSGVFLGTTATFFISRKLGYNFVQKMVKGKAKSIQDKLDENGFIAMLIIRLLGFPPWELINYASGLSKIKYLDYIAATIIGVFPATFIQVYVSYTATTFSIKDPRVWIAAAVFILFITVPTIILKNISKNKKNKVSISEKGAVNG